MNLPLLPFLVVLFTFAILSGGCALTRERSGARTPAAKGKPILFVLNKSDASVSAMDPYGGEELYRLAVGDGPHEAAPSPDGSTVVVCNYGERSPGSSLSIIDVSKRAVVATIDLEFHRPHGILFLDDTRFVVTAEAEKKLLLIDLETRTVLRAIDTEQEISHMVAVTLDGSRAFVANIRSGSVTVIDLDDGKKLKDIVTGAGAEGIAITPDGKEIWVGNRGSESLTIIDSITLEIIAEIPCKGLPIRVAVTPDGRNVLVSCADTGEVALFDTKLRKELRRAKLDLSTVPDAATRLFGDRFGDSPVPVGLVISRDGGTAWVAAR